MMNQMDHPGIAMTLETGYPFPPRPPVNSCDLCGKAIMAGDDYYEIDGAILCEKCVERARHTAEEEIV